MNMAECEVCGNDYYLAFEVITAGRKHVFDSFECAIQKLAPVCAQCGCRIIGHGIEAKEHVLLLRQLRAQSRSRSGERPSCLRPS